MRDLSPGFVVHRGVYRVAWTVHPLDTVRRVHHGDPPPVEVETHAEILTGRLPD